MPYTHKRIIATTKQVKIPTHTCHAKYLLIPDTELPLPVAAPLLPSIELVAVEAAVSVASLLVTAATSSVLGVGTACISSFVVATASTSVDVVGVAFSYVVVVAAGGSRYKLVCAAGYVVDAAAVGLYVVIAAVMIAWQEADNDAAASGGSLVEQSLKRHLKNLMTSPFTLSMSETTTSTPFSMIVIAASGYVKSSPITETTSSPS